MIVRTEMTQHFVVFYKKEKEAAAMAKDMDVLIKTEDRTEVDNVTKLIKTMSESEQNKMLIFLQGVKFAEALKAQPVAE